MKSILILGAGFLQSFIILKAKELGYYTIAIDKNPNSVGFRHADEYGIIDIVDKEACLSYAKSKKIDGVITAATDYGVISTAYVAQQMRLPGLNFEVANIIKNKYLTRRVLFENRIDDIQQYYEIVEIEQLNSLPNSIRFPLMVKPCDGSGSKAVSRVDCLAELEAACSEALKVSLSKRVLIEDFVHGSEYGAESFVYNGEIHILAVMKKHMTNPPKYAELGHCVPSELQTEEKVIEVVKNAINALGINFGAVNMDLLVTTDNRICIVDIGARMGGNLIGSHIIPLAQNIDYIGNLIKAAVGDEIHLGSNLAQQKRNVVTRILALKPGKVIALPDFDAIQSEFGVIIYHSLNIGSNIREYQNNLDGCGYVVAIAEEIRKAEKQAEKAKEAIDEGIIREIVSF